MHGNLQIFLLCILFGLAIGLGLCLPLVHKLQEKQADPTYEAQRDEHGTVYEPNFIALTTRYMNIALSVVLIVYGAYGLSVGSIPVSSRSSGTVMLYGWAAWALVAAIVAASANMLSVVVDHYDARNNQHQYVRFARTAAQIGWLFFLVAVVLKHNNWET